MPVLSDNLRRRLEKAIVAARRVAEAGARRALESLAVERHEPYGTMSPEERTLRNRLRARGRQLGDVRDKARGIQSIDYLAHEVAYEHWHRMLFARFLAENSLLIEPESGVPITIEECDELAREAGEDRHMMAARYAQKALPQIFRSGDPVLEVTLPPEIRQALERLLDGLPSAVFTADDSLGWTYQFWQTEKKEAVNKSGVKIGADELPAVTQLFTEHYMVLSLFHNTIGAWWAGKVLAEHPSLAETARSERELRRAIALETPAGSSPFNYLRFVRQSQEGDEENTPTGPWRPAAGTFEGWPKLAKGLKVLDPCCGSGHFLVVGFKLLVRLRVHEEGLRVEEAIRAVLNDNLYGLELDPRCTQIAAFNLALAAWKLACKPINLPLLHIACSGLAVGSSRKEWTAFAGEDERLRAGMQRLYELFEQAPELGSLIDPTAPGKVFEANFAELQPVLEQVLSREPDQDEQAERAVAAQGMARAAELLSSRYPLVITNVPYLGRGQQSQVLIDFAETHHADAKKDLATIFLSRTTRWMSTGATVAVVAPENWLFLTTGAHFRRRLLNSLRWCGLARLGEEAWESFGMRGPRAILLIATLGKPGKDSGFFGIDASTAPGKTPILIEEKKAILHSGDIQMLRQAGQERNPDHRIAFGKPLGPVLLERFASGLQGIATADYARFGRCFWEMPHRLSGWEYQQSTVDRTVDFGGREHMVLWENGEGALANSPSARIQGTHAWGKDGVAVSQMRTLTATRYTGEAWDNNTAVILPRNPDQLAAIWTFCASEQFTDAVRRLDRKVNVTNATLVKVPFDASHWEEKATLSFPGGLPEPRSDNPTQWLFHGHPAKAETPTILQVGVARLLGYRWPPELDTDMRLVNEARACAVCCDELTEHAADMASRV